MAEYIEKKQTKKQNELFFVEVMVIDKLKCSFWAWGVVGIPVNVTVYTS